MRECPRCSTHNTDESRFCRECGFDLTAREIVTIDSPFTEDDSELIDKILFNVRQAKSTQLTTESDQMIISLGDVVNIPPDYKGSIRTTGKITFSETRGHNIELRYTSGNRPVVKEAEFRTAAIIKRVDDCILIQTDSGTYRITDSMLGPIQRRTFSRTPIAIVHDGDLFYLMCEKEGEYLFLDDIRLEPHSIYRISPLQNYRIGNFASFRIR